MRTTIEMKPEHRAKLFELAARRGAKGFSGLVAEAVGQEGDRGVAGDLAMMVADTDVLIDIIEDSAPCDLRIA